MTSSLLDDLFTPPILEMGDSVKRKQGGAIEVEHGTVVSSGGWFAVIQWDGRRGPRREYIPELELEDC